MKKYILLLHYLGVLILIGFYGTSLFGQTGNPKINTQGILRDITGKTVDDGQYSITFKLYTVKTGGTSIWQETADVDVSGGIYSHQLGSVTQLNPFDFSATLYLGVKLNNFELTPRTELTYAPYTFTVSRALKVVCTGAVGDVKYSILNPTEFATVNGDCWVPMDGTALPPDCKLRQITGMTNLPDAGGLFIRGQEFSGGQDNDPDRTPSSAIATVESDAFKAHSHPASYDGNHTHNFKEYVAYGGYVPDWLSNTDSGPALNNDQFEINLTNRISYAGDHAHNITDTGGSETRVKNLNFWVYIRIN
jgi:hypothetical protein